MAIDSFVTPQDLEKQESRDRTLQDLYAVHNRSTFFKLDTIFNNDYIRPTVVLAFLFRLIFSGRLARIYAIFTNDELDNIGNDYSTRWRRTNIIGLHYVINVKEKKPGVKPQDQAENRVYVRKPQKNACTFSQTETLIVENLDWRLRSKNYKMPRAYNKIIYFDYYISHPGNGAKHIVLEQLENVDITLLDESNQEESPHSNWYHVCWSRTNRKTRFLTWELERSNIEFTKRYYRDHERRYMRQSKYGHIL
ncbi:hypothetical protein F4703DRAFT_1960309 [Phycomyces blakesleeanus]